MTWFVRATGHELSPEISICRGFSKKGRATNGHSNLEKASVKTTQPVDLQGKSLSGSDGTRTRDLRRDRSAVVETELGSLTPSGPRKESRQTGTLPAGFRGA